VLLGKKRESEKRKSNSKIIFLLEMKGRRI